MSFSFDKRKMKVDAYSALAAVCLYHPWRTGASRMMAGEPFTINPRELYKGFVPSVMGAHQLLMLASVYQRLQEDFGNTFAAVAAGVVSTFTITPFDGWTERGRTGAAWGNLTRRVVFRGSVPTAFRQMGLASGMFIFPKWGSVEQNAFSSLAGGVAAAVLTHYPDTVRVIMQNDPGLSLQEACRVGMSRMNTKKGFVACAMRMQVVAIAFFVMHCGREQFPKILDKQKEQII